MSELENTAELNNIGDETATTATSDVAAQPSKAKMFFTRIGKGMKEFFRKRLVALKRRPQYIAVFVYAIALLVITFNQGQITYVTSKIGKDNMGICFFVSLLLSILGFVCLFNAFPKRQKIKWVMLGLYFGMLAVIIACDVIYYGKIGEGLADETLTKEDAFYQVQNIMIAHIVLVVISGVLAGLSPLIGKALKKINTSVDVEGNGDMAAIEMEE